MVFIGCLGRSECRQLALFSKTLLFNFSHCLAFTFLNISIPFLFFKNPFWFSACCFNCLVLFAGINILSEDFYYSFLKKYSLCPVLYTCLVLVGSFSEISGVPWLSVYVCRWDAELMGRSGLSRYVDSWGLFQHHWLVTWPSHWRGRPRCLYLESFLWAAPFLQRQIL